VGCYKTSDGVDIPNDALAIYITVNPRSLKKAAKNSCKILLGRLLDENCKINYNPYKLVLSEIQKANSKTVFYDIDVDNKNISFDELKQYVISNDLINISCLNFLKTRGGFHILVEISKIESIYKSNWYNNMMKIDGVDKICCKEYDDEKVDGEDNLTPIAGCVQGDFVPYLLK